jgi:uncharacterized protein YkwD
MSVKKSKPKKKFKNSKTLLRILFSILAVFLLIISVWFIYTTLNQDTEVAQASPYDQYIRDDLIKELNKQRRENGNLHPLNIQTNLNNSSDWYADYMANNNWFSHTEPNGRTATQRIADFGYTGTGVVTGENIAAGYWSVEEVVEAWMNSPGHRANILDSDYCEIGIGYGENYSSDYNYYWVLNFGCRSNTYPVTINAEDSNTRRDSVDLYIHNTGGANQMRFRNENGAWSNWENYNSNKSWILSTGLGTKTVEVEVRKSNGQTYSYTDTIERVQNNLPTANITRSIYSGNPLDGYTYILDSTSSGDIDVYFDWYDFDSESIQEVKIYLNNSLQTTITNKPDPLYGFHYHTFNSLAEGSYETKLEVTDEDGGKTTVIANFNIDYVDFLPHSYFTWNDTKDGAKTWTLIGNPSTTESVRVRVDIGDPAYRFFGDNLYNLNTLDPSKFVSETFTVLPGQSITPSYQNMRAGPIIVYVEEDGSNQPRDLFTSQRVLFNNDFSEYAGIPANSLSSNYYFTWYDNTNGNNTWILIANPEVDSNGNLNTQSAFCQIDIAGQPKGVYSLTPGEIATPSYPGLINGPVEVECDKDVIATQRSVIRSGGKVSFSEYFGLTESKDLKTEHLFTWNDTTSGNRTWHLIANPETINGNANTQSANLNIYLGESRTLVHSETLLPGQRTFPLIPSTVGGPIIIESDNPVYATQRVLYNGTFNELPSIDPNSLSSSYYYTWSDSKKGNKVWHLVANPSSSQTANCSLSLGSNTTNIQLQPGEVKYPTFTNMTGGPVVLDCDIEVYSTQRVIFNGSFNEMKGIQL